MTKCEFCDIFLKSELDVSKHLAGQTHRDNVRKAASLHPLEKSNLKDDHTNIVQLFESLKLRTAKDVRDLADKHYFNIPSDKPQILCVADELAHMFTKCIADHKTRTSSPSLRNTLMTAFENSKTDTGNARSLSVTFTSNNVTPPPADRSQSNVAPKHPKSVPVENPPHAERDKTQPQVPERPRPKEPDVPRAQAPERPRPIEAVVTRPQVGPPRKDTSKVRPPESVGGSLLGSVGDKVPAVPMNSPPPKRKPVPIESESSPGGRPQPRKDSNFKPQLATIKIEPKDD